MKMSQEDVWSGKEEPLSSGSFGPLLLRFWYCEQTQPAAVCVFVCVVVYMYLCVSFNDVILQNCRPLKKLHAFAHNFQWSEETGPDLNPFGPEPGLSACLNLVLNEVFSPPGVNFVGGTCEEHSGVFREIHASIDTLAFTFGNVVSDFLMGDVDRRSGLGGPQSRRSRSFDDLSADPEERHKRDGGGPDLQLSREEEVDLTLLRNEVGVESALLYAKAWSKHIKDLLVWMEKRASMDIEYAKNYNKIAESAKVLVSQQDFMPFSDIYVSTFKKDIEHNALLLQTAVALQANKFIQPLLARRNELDKLRKEVKEQWQREQRKMHEADAALRKAQSLAEQRREEYRKLLSSSSRSSEEQGHHGNKQLERRRRLEEEALQKAEEAQDQFHSCRADAGVRRMDLANAKRTALTQLREMIFQCDLTLKAVTVNWLQMQQTHTVVGPPHYQALNENAKLYEPGECYAEFVRNLPRNLPKEHLHSVSFEASRFGFNRRFLSSSHSSQGNLSQTSSTLCDEGDAHHLQHGKIGEERSSSSTDLPASRNQAQRKAWATSSQVSQGGMCSDSESAGGSSESRSIDSPTASPGDFKRRLPRTPSTGTMSSADDLDDREPPSPSDNGPAELVTSIPSSPGPFRNAQMSKAAQTHKLRKLRAPSKCRECDSLVVFHGAECEECSLACHKKCLETLAIQCGHKKLLGKLQLFGVDFALAAKDSADRIPFIIKKCTSEIESRALNVKGIYRVNGAKSRVEKLCQAFENGKDLVELSEHSPHDISNVLKLYLRQLPEPLILHRYYNDFIGLAKESQRVSKEGGRNQSAQRADKDGPSPHLKKVIFRVRELLSQLPASHFATLRFLTAHLNRVAEHAEENKMTASNLGIIFGPTLVKPQQTDAEVSLSSLVDYPYQVLMVELLVRHFHLIFDASPLPGSETAAQASPRLTPQEKAQQLSKHSTSLTDMKENAKVFKRFSSVIPSTHILDEVQEVEPGKDQTGASDRSNGEPTSPGEDGQRSTLMFDVPPSTVVPPKIQLRSQRGRQASRPISMPLERTRRNTAGEGCERDAPPESIQEEPEPDRARPSGSSRMSSYYIAPFIDTQTMPRRTWDRKYKHYDVTPRTAMIIANLPPPCSGLQPLKGGVTATSEVCGSGSENPPSPVVPASVAKKDSLSLPLTLRAPRTLQPPPGTFYKPPVSSTLTNGDAPVTPTTSPPCPKPSSPLTSATVPVSPEQIPLPTQASTDSPPPPLSAPSSSSDCKPVQQRLRPRRLQELEQRESHFV
uniref:Rho GTPase-activating protein 29 n=1 Tax=Oryzias melastigma TaxID=30732 RepID=A0A3B3CNC5_ORYME